MFLVRVRLRREGLRVRNGNADHFLSRVAEVTAVTTRKLALI